MKKPYSRTAATTSEPSQDEVLPQDGLTVTGEDPAEEVAEEVADEPLPSVPVDEPVIQTPAPAADAMHFLGTAAMDGMLGRGGARRAAAYPVVVYAATGHTVGVVVVGEPADMNLNLAQSLERAGHAGAPFRFEAAVSQPRPVKLAAARAIAAQRDAALDRVGALMSLGFTPESLA